MRPALALAVSCALAVTTTAHADARVIAPTMPHYGYDLAFVATSGALVLTARLALSPRDRGAAPLDGRGAHVYQPRADVVSDVTYMLVLGSGMLVGYLLDGSRDGDYAHALRVPIIALESYLATVAIGSFVKLSGVCRPYSWEPETTTCGDGVGVPDGYDEQRRAFTSGHAAGVASVSGALLGMWLLPTGRDDRLAPLALGMTALSLATAALRVRAGAHSLVDVGAGFGLGLGVGVATSALHLRAPDARVSVTATANGLQVHGTF